MEDECRVRYVIVGGEAVIYYGFTRLTGDIELFYEAEGVNVRNLFQALKLFWGGEIPGITDPDELAETGKIFQFGAPPNRIDLLNQIDGVAFPEAWEGRETAPLERGGKRSRCYFIGLRQLIQNKQALTRYKDLEDLKYLERAWSERQG
jgi:hypothetical protein